MKKGTILMLVVLYAAGFIAAFNENIINVVLVDIMNEFSVSSLVANWLVTGYMIITAIVVSLMAFFYERFSLRTLLFSASALLIFGSIGAFLAPTFVVLLIFRLLQAVGTGVFITLMMTSVLAIAPKQKMGTFLAIGSCCITFGPALAPVVSGAVATFFGWRFVFVVPTVAIAIVLILGIFSAKNINNPHYCKLDVASMLLSALFLVALVYGFTELTSQTILALVCLIVGIVLMALFGLRQTRIENPLINIEPLQNRSFVVACVLSVVAMMTTFSMSVILMLYYEGALGLNALVSGALLLIPILINSVTAVMGGRVMDKCGPWPLLPMGFAVIVIGQAFIAYTSASSSLWLVVVGSAVTYAGVGLVFSPSQTAGLSAIDAKQHASGVSLINLCIQLAACIGPALFVGVYSSILDGSLSSGLLAESAQAQGFSAAVWVAAFVALCGFAVSYFFARNAKKVSLGATAEKATNTSSSSLSETIPAASVGKQAPTLEPTLRVVDMPGFAHEVYTAPHNASVAEVAQVMVDHKTGTIPLVDKRNHVAGVVSDGDIIRYLTGGENKAPLSSADALWQALRSASVQEQIPHLLEKPALSIATTKVVSLPSDATLESACSVLSDKQVKKVPVVEKGILVGTISRSDLLRIFLRNQLTAAQ